MLIRKVFILTKYAYRVNILWLFFLKINMLFLLNFLRKHSLQYSSNMNVLINRKLLEQ